MPSHVQVSTQVRYGFISEFYQPHHLCISCRHCGRVVDKPVLHGIGKRLLHFSSIDKDCPVTRESLKICKIGRGLEFLKEEFPSKGG